MQGEILMNNLIELTDVKKTYGTKDSAINALQGVSVSIKEGEMVAIMGKSGCGKSTLLNILGGLITMDSGEYYYKGEKVITSKQKNLTMLRRKEIGFIVQYFALVDDMNIYKNVELPLKYLGYSSKERKSRVLKALEELELSAKKKAYPTELSGGQQQRVAIARAIVKNPDLILADEPTGALDEMTGEIVMDIFRKLNKNGKTIIIVTHDPNIAAKCDRTIRLRDGMIINDVSEGGDLK